MNLAHLSGKSFSSFSPRSFEPGTTLRFFSQNGEFVSVVKHMREVPDRRIIIRRIEKLLPLITQDLVAQYADLAALEVGQLDTTPVGESVLVIKPVKGRSVQSLYRSHPWSSPLNTMGQGVIALLQLLHHIDPGVGPDKGDLAQNILDDFTGMYHETQWLRQLIDGIPIDTPGMSVRVVHNDLSPGNVLFGNQKVSLIDWEYWEPSYSVFNLLDVLTTFAPVAQRLKLGRRRVEDYLYLLQLPVSKLPASFAISLQAHWADMGLAHATADQLDALVRVYLAGKSTLQWRSYGRTGDMDLFWKSVYDEFDQSPATYLKLPLGLSA